MGFRLLASFALALVLLTPAAAQPAGDEASTAAARALFAEGVQAAEAGDHAAAADRFQRALTLRWAPPIAYNLAEAQARLGRYVEAIENLHAIERSNAPDDVKENARLRREALEPNVGRLRIVLAPDEPGLVIQVDGRALPEALRGMAFPVDPGERVLTVLRGAQQAGRATATVVAGAETSVHVEVAAPLPTPEAIAAEEERRRALEEEARLATHRQSAQRRKRRLGGALGAVGALLVGAVVVGILVATRPEADPRVNGNFDPPRLEGRVEGVSP
ncbi:MAG: tetratricopeptide repeat protein [Sandaracinus sp.]|nr:tetratricopeptide repeat protein [Sandaracinus sp.]MCB9619651.1 tetratricopeptide repeat protein [Sandaracinus sp.]MCB9635008.1 tetratricopeptide repeat protein [Sandaracinus sp.]